MAKDVVPFVDSRVILAKKKRKVFLKALAQTCSVSAASRACGYSDTSALQKFRREDEDFAEDWDLALEAGANFLEEEALRRATEGVLEPVFYKGEITGYVTKHSDTLLMFLLRGAKPNTYRDTSRGGEINMNVGIAVLPMTAASEGDWENRAGLMHDNQQTITIEAKPVENHMSRITRSD